MLSVLLAIKIGFAEAMGFWVLLPACILHAWTEPTTPSIKPIMQRTHVDEWKWKWLNNWYGNSEDGVSGQQAYVWDSSGHLVHYTWTYPSWVPQWVIAYGWSAWRNGANNLKRPLRTDGLNASID